MTATIITIKKDSKFEVKDVETVNLKALQTEVEGRIEPASWFAPNILNNNSIETYINEEGRFTRELNLTIDLNGQYVQIFGNIVLCGFDPEEGEDLGLTDEQVTDITTKLTKLGFEKIEA